MTNINTKNWQPSNNTIGDIVYGRFEIDQALDILLTTPKGSDPLRPEFGCDAFIYVDKPIDIARPNIVREVVSAIKRFEKRIVLDSVLVLQQQDQVIVDITYTLSGISYKKEVSYD